MSMLRIVMDIAKIKLSDYKDIDKYTSVYHGAYNRIFGPTTKNSDLSIKKVDMLLQIAILLDMGNEYARIMSTFELEWKNKSINVENTIF